MGRRSLLEPFESALVVTLERITFNWVLVKGFNLSYYNQETILFTIDPDYGS